MRKKGEIITIALIFAELLQGALSKREVRMLKGYYELNSAACDVLEDGGILATFSCSHHMPNEAFFEMLKKAAASAGRKYVILKRCHQAEDHPIVRAIPETEYLKGYFIKVDRTG